MEKRLETWNSPDNSEIGQIKTAISSSEERCRTLECVEKWIDNCNFRGRECRKSNTTHVSDRAVEMCNTFEHRGENLEGNMTVSAKNDVCDGHVQTVSCIHAEQNMGSRNGVTNPLEISLPAFENLPTQNARAHLIVLLEYMSGNNVPPHLQLAVAKRFL